MADRIELAPVESTRDETQPLSKRRHFARRRDVNGHIEWVKQGYSNRSNAKRAITNDHSLDGLEIRLLDYEGETIRVDREAS